MLNNSIYKLLPKRATFKNISAGNGNQAAPAAAVLAEILGRPGAGAHPPLQPKPWPPKSMIRMTLLKVSSILIWAGVGD